MTIQTAIIIKIVYLTICYLGLGYCISRIIHDDFKQWEHLLFTIGWPFLWLEEFIIDLIYENK